MNPITPTIACFNRAETPLGIDFDELISAMQSYVTDYVAPVWGTPAKLEKSTDFVKNAWAMVFLDDADQPGALAYHDLTIDGMPLAKVFVATTREAGEEVSVSASHELVEMLVDPAINTWVSGPDLQPIYGYADTYPVQMVPIELYGVTAMYAYESADPVEEITFKVDGVAMSDFVYPAYFEDFQHPPSTIFDYKKKVKQPFELLPGGYQIIFTEGNFGNVFGSKAKERRFAQEDRRGHRSETRKRGKLQTARLSTLRRNNLIASGKKVHR
jgi:hypothetical protein